jgi:hypothetical protein
MRRAEDVIFMVDVHGVPIEPTASFLGRFSMEGVSSEG